jgi:protoheme IX farnesyltransferase
LTSLESRIESVVATPADAARSRSTASVLIETTKQGISRLVTVTAMVGFVMVTAQRDAWNLSVLVPAAIGCGLGTWLSASGANALNMWLEGGRDALMNRTQDRPIPSGRIEPKKVAIFGTVLSLLGVLTLALLCGIPAALVSLACVVSYVLVYTPMKTRTIWNTLIGTIPGALPALIGTAAASPRGAFESLTDPFGLALVLMMVIWQLPHFMAIAWMYREDYKRGGYRMLTGIDQTGRATGWVMAITAALFIPAVVALGLLAPDTLGPVYMAVAGLVCLGFLAMAVVYLRSPTDRNAKRVFLASVMVLPLLYLLMVGEAAVRLLL